MTEVKVIGGQSLVDIAIAYCGGLSALPALALMNGIGITEMLYAGQAIVVPDHVNDTPLEVEVSFPILRYQVMPGDTLADIAVRNCGSLSVLPELAALNGLSITGEIIPGQVLSLPKIARDDPLVINGIGNGFVNIITSKPGQSLADLAIQYCGSLSALPTLAALNGFEVTAQISPGQLLKRPDPVDKKVVSTFEIGSYFPATGDILKYGDGIGWWIIENDFIVQ